VPPPSPEALLADIEEETALHRSLQVDLKDALLAGENTSPYRRTIADLGEKIARLRSQYDASLEAEGERRRAAIAVTAREISEGARRRFTGILESLTPPPPPFTLELKK